MQLIVVTTDTDIQDELQTVNRLFANGMKRLHLRKPGYTAQDYRNYINAVDAKYHSGVVLCGGFELLKEFKLGGAHLNSNLRNDKAVWQQITAVPPSNISTSFHSWQEIADNETEYGYVFISPVFDSISKQGYKAGIALKGMNKTKQELVQSNRYCPSIIGLGGVGAHQIEVLHQYGFDGAAVLGVIWKSEDPTAIFTELSAVTKSLSR